MGGTVRGRKLLYGASVGLAALVGLVAYLMVSDAPAEPQLAVQSTQPRLSPAADRPGPGLDGKTIYQTVEGLCETVDPFNAPRTARALERAGFSAKYTLLAPGILPRGRGSRQVSKPPPGTVVVGVTSTRGAYTDVPSDTKQLAVEIVTDPGSEPIGRDATC